MTFLKRTMFSWPGSKDKNFKEIKQYFPKNFSIYYEPFAGSGAVYFRLLAERGSFPAILADKHAWLIHTYSCIRDTPDIICQELPIDRSKEAYNHYKNSYVRWGTPLWAVQFLYLNRNSMFGLGGRMTADRYARDQVIERIKFFSPLMQQTEFVSDCNDPLFDFSNKDAFFFVDPPYIGANNKACYHMNETDEAIVKLNVDYATKLCKGNAKFFFVTKYDERVEKIFLDHNVNCQKVAWKFRKPGQKVQEDYELYGWRQ